MPTELRLVPTSAFGEDTFGRKAEAAARFFGTPKYILGQTLIVIAWIAVNAVAISFRWDPYPFILLNLAFSTQAAYAAPLILLAQTRQADRDKIALDQLEAHRGPAQVTEPGHGDTGHPAGPRRGRDAPQRRVATFTRGSPHGPMLSEPA